MADTEISSGSVPPPAKVQKVVAENVPSWDAGAKAAKKKSTHALRPSQSMGTPKPSSFSSASKKKKQKQLKKQAQGVEGMILRGIRHVSFPVSLAFY